MENIMLTSCTKCLLLLWYVGTGLAIETYFMSDYCNGEIDMILQDIYASRLSIDGAYSGDCNVTIETWYSADKLMFYFEDIDLPDAWNRFCDDNYLQVYDKNALGEFQLMHGLHHKICGSHPPSQIFVPRGRYVMFRYVSNGTTMNKMNVVFTAFHTGSCRNFEYRCSNDRCIDDSVNCNGLNPCGDFSDCHLSGAAIAGIVTGSVFVTCVCLTLVLVWLRNKRGPPKIRTVQNFTSPTSPLIIPATHYGTSDTGYSRMPSYAREATPDKDYQIQAKD